MIIAFTGHRPTKIGGYIVPNPTYDYIYEKTKRILSELKPTKAYCGMALGFDQLAASVCIELGIPFIAAIPHDNQEKIWPQKSQQKYHELLQKAEEKIIVCPGSYSAKKMQVRNEFMVDNSDIIVACWNGSEGGTYNCVQYAKSQEKKIIQINPGKK